MNRWLRVTYATAVAGILYAGYGMASLKAEWANGCCSNDSSECAGTMICCTVPSGWGNCSDLSKDYCDDACPPTPLE